ncbi:MAG: Gfo/Idh/MocA family oxidoreductase [Planctomycetaceae bacterium]|nr:Gfo/Idh/MocA family oxidoreductase [Planctomycetaceae bacterium]
MIRIGIVGFGFMGKMHFQCYQQIKNVKIAAVCDVEMCRLSATGTVGNIRGSKKVLDLKGIPLYSDFDKMVKEQNLDAVSITLPTYLHYIYTIKAIKAGLHTLCEKPMALNTKDCKKMIDAAKKYKKILQIGHCIRFWPEYIYLRNIVNSGKYGRVLGATFQRLSYAPIWSWNNWFMDKNKSGGAILDLHIHDSDYVQYLFGTPKKVFSRGIKGPSKGTDYIVTNFIYDDNKVITAEGGWTMKKGFGFEMSFNVMLERATISYDCTRTPVFKVATDKGKLITPKLPKNNGYMGELLHFIKAINGKKIPAITTPQDSLNSVKIVLAEKKSAQTGRTISLK